MWSATTLDLRGSDTRDLRDRRDQLTASPRTGPPKLLPGLELAGRNERINQPVWVDNAEHYAASLPVPSPRLT